MYQQAKDLIKAFEGFVPVSKPCPAGYPTYGWGHRVQSNGLTITKAAAEVVLDQDVQNFATVIQTQIPGAKNMNDDQLSALISFVFNTGTLGTGLKAALIKDIDSPNVAAEMLKWKYAKNPKTGIKEVNNGLVNRRKKEVELYTTGIKKKAK
jgi:GH24 family phage-related lysozyme (muramidase)